MRLLITGITGRVGANVAKRFVDLGHDVTGFVWTNDRQSEKVASIGADVIEGDLASNADVRRAADGAEAIFISVPRSKLAARSRLSNTSTSTSKAPSTCSKQRRIRIGCNTSS